MSLFAANTIKVLWKRWFVYALCTIGVFFVVLVLELAVGDALQTQAVVLIIQALFCHHFFIVGAARWLEKAGGHNQLSWYQKIALSVQFYGFIVATPTVLVWFGLTHEWHA